MSVEFDRGSPGKSDSRTLNRKTLRRWTGRIGNSLGVGGSGATTLKQIYIYIYI